MKFHQAGFTVIELLVTLTLITVMGGAAASVIIYTLDNNQRSTNHISAVFYAETAGRWITRDAMMSNSITTDNVTFPDLIQLRWTDWSRADNPVYHVVTYSVNDLSGHTGKLTRHHNSSSGVNDNLTITQNLYYDPSDTANTTRASYQSSILDIRVSTVFPGASAVREYRISGRPNF